MEPAIQNQRPEDQQEPVSEFSNLDDVTRLDQLLSLDRPSTLLIPQRNPNQQQGEVDGAPTQAVLPDYLRVERGQSTESVQAVSEQASLLIEERLEEKKRELRQARILLVGDAHSLSDDEIDAMSIDQMLEKRAELNLHGSISNLEQDKEYLDSCWNIPVARYLSVGYWSGDHHLALDRVDHSRAMAEDYQRTVLALKEEIAEAEEGLSAMREAETQRSESLVKAREAQSSGDLASLEIHQKAVDQATELINTRLENAFENAATETHINWASHQKGFEFLRKQAQEVDQAYEQQYQMVKKIAIITIAATTTAMTGGAAAGIWGTFWGSVLLGTAVGGATAVGWNTAEELHRTGLGGTNRGVLCCLFGGRTCYEIRWCLRIA